MQQFAFSKVISLQSCITVTKINNQLLIKGPLGVSFLVLPKNLFWVQRNLKCQFFSSVENQNLVLTYYKLLCLKIKGVHTGFFEVLCIHGVGWRVSLEENLLCFSLGYSHPVRYALSSDIEAILYNKQQFKIFGLDLTKVQQVVVDLCSLRSFDVYKGKGIYKQGQIFKLKESSKSKA